MSETFTIQDQVLFTFLLGAGGEPWVEITIGTEQRRVTLGRFLHDLELITHAAWLRYVLKESPRVSNDT